MSEFDYTFTNFTQSANNTDYAVISNITLSSSALLNAIFKNGDKFKSKLSSTGDLVFGWVLIFTGLLSILGNGSTLAVFYFRRRNLSPAEIFLVNLGIVDILLAVASYPWSMLSGFHHKWLFGPTGCTIYGFTCYFLGLACLASLTAIAVIRYLKTCSPSTGNRILCSTSLKIIVWVYIYALFWATLPLIGFGNYEVEPFGLSCTLEWFGSSVFSRAYILLVTIFCVFIPFGIIIFCYTQIVLLVRTSDKLIGDSRSRRQNPAISDVQLTWMSCIITSGFIIAWLPYTIVSLWGTFTGEILLPMWATTIPVLMAKSSIAYNPIIYIFLTRRYREDFYNILSSTWNAIGDTIGVGARSSSTPSRFGFGTSTTNINNTNTIVPNSVAVQSTPLLSNQGNLRNLGFRPLAIRKASSSGALSSIIGIGIGPALSQPWNCTNMQAESQTLIPMESLAVPGANQPQVSKDNEGCDVSCTTVEFDVTEL